MLKFAKYFFAVFLITMVIPLLLMLFWNHQQMKRMGLEKQQHMLYVGSKQLDYVAKQYLKIRESYVLEKIQDFSQVKLTQEQIRKVFGSDVVEFIYNKPIKNVLSYYDVFASKGSKKQDLYCVTVLPYKMSGISGIKISEKVDFDQLRPQGPFDIKVYVGDKINKSSYLGSAYDPVGKFNPGMNPHQGPPDFDNPDGLMPPDQDMNSPHMPPAFDMGPGHHEGRLPPPSADINYPKMMHENDDFNVEPINKQNAKYEKVSITDNKGKTVAVITLNINDFFGHKDHPDNPFEKEFGLVVLIAGSISSLLIGYYINNNFINPLLILSNASKQIQEGNLSVNLVTNIKEKQILNTFNNFNQMIKGLKEKEELRKSFVTNLTHDLRTPLIAQERALKLISKEFEILGLQDAFKLAKGTEKNLEHLLRMVNLILESYSFDSENLNLIFLNLNMQELIDNCFENLKPLAQEKNIELINKISDDFPLVYGDRTSINRIFINLISNSIDSISDGGKIHIDTQVEDSYVKIFVEDNGPGIASEEIGFIFDRHYTGKSADRKIGSGFGLYVCKKLVELHKGEITVESEINNYTKFIIKLPRYREG